MSNRNRTRLPRRVFLQPGGPGFNPLEFQGLDTQDIAITGAKRERKRGSGNEAWVPDPLNAGGYELAAVTYDPPSRAEFTLEMLELEDGSIPAQFLDHNCLNAYVLGGECGDLSNFNTGWRGYVEVYSDAEQDDAADLGDRTSLDGDEMLKSSLAMKAKHIYAVGELHFSDILEGVTADGVSDVIVSAPRKCDGCANAKSYNYDVYILDVGATKQVLVRKHGDPTVVSYPLPSHVYEEYAKMAIVGGNLVIPFSEAASGSGDGGYVYAPINDDGGLGSFVSVDAGLGDKIEAVYALNRRAFMVFRIALGAPFGSWLYFTNVGGTDNVEVLTNARKSASAINDLFVTIRNDDIVYTRDGKRFYAAPTGAALGGDTRIAIVDQMTWYVIYNQIMLRTDDSGRTWVSRTVPVVGADVTFIAAATREVLYYHNGDEGNEVRLYASWSGGMNWTYEAPRVNNIGSDHFVVKALAAPLNADSIVKDANYVVIAYSSADESTTHVMEGTATLK